MTEREKIIETLRASGYGFFITHEITNADEALADAADALIAAGIGDVTEYKKIIHDLNTDVVAYRALSKADTLGQIIEGQKSLIDEYKHRAEVAERALLFLCDKTMSDISVMIFPSTKTQVQNKQELYDYCIKQAEKELVEVEE